MLKRRRSGRVARYLSSGLIVLAILLVSVPDTSFTTPGSGGDVSWQYGDLFADSQQAQAMVVDSTGAVIVTGFTRPAGVYDFYTAKLGAGGGPTVWSVAHDQNGGEDRSTAIAVDSNDDVIIAGYVLEGTTFDFYTVKYAGADGAVLWQRRYNAPANGHDFATSIDVGPANEVYVGGYGQSGVGSDDFILVKYAADGTFAWDQAYDGTGAGHDRIFAVAATSDGAIVTGESQNASPDFDCTTVKFTSAGVLDWNERRALAGDDSCSAIELDGTDVYVAGGGTGANGTDLYLAKRSAATGGLSWDFVWDGGADDLAQGIAVDGSGDVYVTGRTFSMTTANDLFIGKLAGGTGQLLWSEKHNTDDGNSDVGFDAITVVSQYLFVGGETFDPATGNFDFLLVKYAAVTGSMLWERRFDGAANKDERFAGMGLAPNGDVIVAGFSDAWTAGASDYDYYAVAYSRGNLNRPTGLVATADTVSEVTLTWVDNAAIEDGFEVQRKTGVAGVWGQIATVGVDVETYVDATVAAGTGYYYRVRAYNGVDGDSDFSDEAFATTAAALLTAPDWFSLYDGPDSNDDQTVAVAVGPDNHPVIAGSSFSTLGQFDYLTLKLDRANGNALWEERHNGDQENIDMPAAVAVDASNGIAVTGYSVMYSPSAGNTNDVYTLKYDATGGARVWGDQYNGPGDDDDRASVVVVASDGSWGVAGYGRNLNWDDDIYALKIDASGNRLWTATPYDGGVTGHDVAADAAFDAAGNLYVVGRTSNGTNDDLFVARYDSASGNRAWTELYVGAGGGDDAAVAVAVDATTAALYVCGYAVTASGSRDALLLKRDAATGSLLWERSRDGLAGGADACAGLGVDPITHDVVIGATTLVVASNNDFETTRYDSDGNLLWTTTLARPSHDDTAKAVTVDQSGNVYVAGDTDDGVNVDAIAVVYDIAGAQIGGARFDNGGNREDRVRDIAVNRLGEAFVVGSATSIAGDFDFMIFALSTSALQVPAPSVAAPLYTTVDLTWSDNSTNEDGYYVDRKDVACTEAGTWLLLTTTLPDVTSYQDTARSVDTAYCYRVRAFVGAEVSGPVLADALTLLPQPPDTLNAAATSTTSIDLSWADHTTGETGFRIQRCQGAGCSNFADLTTVAADVVAYTDTTPCHSGLYRYQVQAYKTGEWTTTYSAVAAATTGGIAAPSVTTATRLNEGSIRVNWTSATSDQTGFYIERCEGAGCSTFAQIATAAAGATSYTNSGLNPDTSYSYRVKAYKASSCNWETGVGPIGTAVTTLIDPSNARCTTSNSTRLNFYWNDNTGTENNFQVERCQGAGCSSFAALSTEPANRTYKYDTTVCAGTTYRYRVRAIRTVAPVWQTAYATTVDYTTPGPGAPHTLTVTPLSESQIRLNWVQTSNDESGFKIERCQGTGCSSFVQIATAGVNATTYTNSGLAVGTTYRYRVRAYKTATCGWDSAYTNEAETTTQQPPAPSGLNAVGTNTTRITVTWADNTGSETLFRLQRCQGTGCSSFTDLTTRGANVTSYTDNSVCHSTVYRYRVRAENGVTWQTAWSNEDEVAPPTPNAPVTLTATATSESQILVSWSDGLSDETGFQLESCAGAGCSTFALETTRGANQTSYTVNLLPPNSPYSYRVRAYKTATCGWTTGYSPVDSATTLVPPPPTALNVTVQNTTELSQSWQDNTGSETGFRLERCEGASCDFTSGVVVKNLGINATSNLDTDLCHSTTYRYRVRAEKTNGPNWTTAWSLTASNTTSTPLAPSAVAATVVSDTTVALSWTDNTGDETGFKVQRCQGIGCSNYVDITTVAADVTTHVDTTASGETNYGYRIAAYKTATCAWQLDGGTDSVLTAPTAPGNLAALALNSQVIRLDWVDFAAAEDGFDIERQLWNGIWVVWATAPADAIAFVDTLALEPGKQSRYRVRARRGPDLSEYSDEVVVTTPAWQATDHTCF